MCSWSFLRLYYQTTSSSIIATSEDENSILSLADFFLTGSSRSNKLKNGISDHNKSEFSHLFCIVTVEITKIG